MKKVTVDGIEFYVTPQGDYLPRVASPETIKMARELNAGNEKPFMRGAFRLEAWHNNLFAFRTNKSRAVYGDDGNGNYVIQLDMKMPENRGNGF